MSNSDIRPVRCQSRDIDQGEDAVREEPPDEACSSPSLQPQVSKHQMFLAMPEPRTFTISHHPPTAPNDPLRTPMTTCESSSTDVYTIPSILTNSELCLEVLVIDDDPLTCTLMKCMLSRLGCQVSMAENGELALEMILGVMQTSAGSDSSENAVSAPSSDKFAIVFLDNQMPVLSGLKTVEKLRNEKT